MKIVVIFLKQTKKKQCEWEKGKGRFHRPKKKIPKKKKKKRWGNLTNTKKINLKYNWELANQLDWPIFIFIFIQIDLRKMLYGDLTTPDLKRRRSG